MLVYEPELTECTFFNSELEKDLNVFKENSDIIVANRVTSDLKDVYEKVFTRDLFGAD